MAANIKDRISILSEIAEACECDKKAKEAKKAEAKKAEAAKAGAKEDIDGTMSDKVDEYIFGAAMALVDQFDLDEDDAMEFVVEVADFFASPDGDEALPPLPDDDASEDDFAEWYSAATSLGFAGRCIELLNAELEEEGIGEAWTIIKGERQLDTVVRNSKPLAGAEAVKVLNALALGKINITKFSSTSTPSMEEVGGALAALKKAPIVLSGTDKGIEFETVSNSEWESMFEYTKDKDRLSKYGMKAEGASVLESFMLDDAMKGWSSPAKKAAKTFSEMLATLEFEFAAPKGKAKKAIDSLKGVKPSPAPEALKLLNLFAAGKIKGTKFDAKTDPTAAEVLGALALVNSSGSHIICQVYDDGSVEFSEVSASDWEEWFTTLDPKERLDTYDSMVQQASSLFSGDGIPEDADFWGPRPQEAMVKVAKLLQSLQVSI